MQIFHVSRLYILGLVHIDFHDEWMYMHACNIKDIKYSLLIVRNDMEVVSLSILPLSQST